MSDTFGSRGSMPGFGKAHSSPALKLTSTRSAPLVEAVLPGHLPGFPGTWVSQYARQMADRYQGSALVRFEMGRIRLERFEGRSGAAASGPVAATAPNAPPLQKALEELMTRVGAWLVMIDEPYDLPQRRWIGELDTWTILTGGDGAAVVAAYRLIKSLLQGPAALKPRSVQLMFCGCDDQQASLAADRIRQTAGSFLSTRVAIVGAQKQMQPVQRQDMGRFNGLPLPDLWGQLRDFLRRLAEPAPPVGTAQPEPALQTKLSPDELNALNGQTTPAVHPEEITALQQATIKNSTAPTSLARVINLRPLQAACPSDAAIQLAVDNEGHVHLLLLDSGQSAPQSACRLLAAGAWAMDHRLLLALADPRAQLNPEKQPVLHLFTHRPLEAIELAKSGFFRLHLFKDLPRNRDDGFIHQELV